VCTSMCYSDMPNLWCHQGSERLGNIVFKVQHQLAWENGVVPGLCFYHPRVFVEIYKLQESPMTSIMLLTHGIHIVSIILFSNMLPILTASCIATFFFATTIIAVPYLTPPAQFSLPAPFKCPSPNEVFHDPHDCQAFYECWNGIAYTMRCDPHSCFNIPLLSCDACDFVDCGTNEVYGSDE
jgi:hypothetical protein